MSKLHLDADGKYQNISRIQTSVVRKTADGIKSAPVAPAQIVDLSEEDVRATNDRYPDPDDSPLNNGMIEKIPEGKDRHPDAPNLGKHPSGRKVDAAIRKLDLDTLDKLMSTIMDMGGIVRVRSLTSRAVTDGRIGEDDQGRIDRLIQKHENRVREVVSAAEEQARKLLG